MMRGFAAAVMALTGLLPLCRAQEELTPTTPFGKLYWDENKLAPSRWTLTRGMLIPRFTTDKTGRVIRLETPGSQRDVAAPEPITNVVPSSNNSLSSGSGGEGGTNTSLGGGALATVASSPFYTFFAFTDAGKVLQFDLQNPSGAVTRTLATGQSLKAGAVSPQNVLLYAVSTGTSGGFLPSVQIIDLTTFQTTGSIPLPASSIPAATALTPDGKYLYVAGPLRAQTFTDPEGVDCHIIDMTTRTILTTLHFAGSLPRPELLMSPDGGRVFLTVAAGVAVIDTVTQSLSHTIPQASFFGTLHIAIDPSGSSEVDPISWTKKRPFLDGAAG